MTTDLGARLAAIDQFTADPQVLRRASTPALTMALAAIARELLAAVRKHQGVTETQWGVRYGNGVTVPVGSTREAAVEYAASVRRGPVRIVRREVTMTEWRDAS